MALSSSTGIEADTSQVIKEDWLYREEAVPGSLATWKKRWSVLTLQKLQCFKYNTDNEPISSISVASIEEMAYGAAIGDKMKKFAFSLTTPRGIIKLAADNEEIREKWVTTLRALVPKAKVELAKEMLLRKAKRKANLELAQQQIKEAIESILRDSKRVAVRGGFKTYADALAECFQGLLKSIDSVSEMGLNSAKQTAYSIKSIVDAANSAAAICTNRAIQDEIVIRTRDIAIETANLLGFATTASHDNDARAQMYESVESIQEQVRELLELLAAAGALQQELDDARGEIERAVEAPCCDPQILQDANIEANIQSLSDRARILSTTIKNIANNACVTPERVGEYSKEAAELLCELLDATNIVAINNGVDLNDPAYISSASDVNDLKKRQMETLLAAAKGFAAATTNMIDLLKEVPQQEDDENIQFRLSMATRSADSALNAFMTATQSADGASNYNYDSGIADFNSSPAAHAESDIMQALTNIEESVKRFTLSPAYAKLQSEGGADGANFKNNPHAPVILAAKQLCDATATLMGATATNHREIKQKDPDVYRKDPNWATGVATAAKAVAETVGQFVEVSCDPSSSPEDIVAAARCVNSSAESLVSYTRQKSDPDSKARSDLEIAARGIAKATNFLVEMAKQGADANNGPIAKDDFTSIKSAARAKQLQMEFEAQTEIARLEAELDSARDYLFKLKRTVYGGNPAGGDGLSGMPSFR